MGDGTFKHGYGLFIGVGGKDIPVTVEDATALYSFITDTNKAAYPKSQAKLLTEKNATRQNILDNLDWLALQTKANPKSTVIIYYSGHGGRIEHLFRPNEYYLIPHGYNPAKRDETAVSGIEFTKKIESIQAKKLIILLDCCHAGGIPVVKESDDSFIKSPIPPELLKVLEIGTGYVIIASSLEDEYSLTDTPYSIFTSCLLDALRGNASIDEDGYARILDVLIYLFREVPKRSSNVQHPLLKKALELGENFPICYYAGSVDDARRSFSPHRSINSKKIGASVTEGRRERLRLELASLRDEYALRLQKITRIRKALLIESDVSRVFQYEQILLDEERALSTLNKKIEDIEDVLGS